MGCNSSKKKLNGENVKKGEETVNKLNKNNKVDVKGNLNKENEGGKYQNFKDSNEDDWLSQLKQEVNQSYIDDKNK